MLQAVLQEQNAAGAWRGRQPAWLLQAVARSRLLKLAISRWSDSDCSPAHSGAAVSRHHTTLADQQRTLLVQDQAPTAVLMAGLPYLAATATKDLEGCSTEVFATIYASHVVVLVTQTGAAGLWLRTRHGSPQHNNRSRTLYAGFSLKRTPSAEGLGS